MTNLEEFLAGMKELSEGPAAICHWNGMGQYNRESESYEGPHHYWSWSEGCSYRGLVYQAYGDTVWNYNKPDTDYRHANLSVQPEKTTFAVIREFLTKTFVIADRYDITIHTSVHDWFARFTDSKKGLQFGGTKDKHGFGELLNVSYTERQIVTLLHDLGCHPFCSTREVKGNHEPDERHVNVGSIARRPMEHADTGFVADEDSLFAPGWEKAAG